MGLESYHNDESLKESIISHMVSSKCGVFNIKDLEGCLGIPEWVGKIQDVLFCKFTKDEDYKSRMSVFKSIPVGIDLEPIKHKFLIYLYSEFVKIVNNQQMIEGSIKEDLVSSTKSMIDIHERSIQLRLWEHEESSKERSERFSIDLSSISKAFNLMSNKFLSEKDSLDLYRKCSKKLFEMLKNENNVLLFKFDNIKHEINPIEIKVSDEYEPLMASKSIKGIQYLKLLFRRTR